MKQFQWAIFAVSLLPLFACQSKQIQLPIMTTQSHQMVRSQNSVGQDPLQNPALDQELGLLSQKVRKKIFDDRDLNHDQILDRKEFGPPLEDYENIFRSIDANQNGHLSWMEVQKGPALHYYADVTVMKNMLKNKTALKFLPDSYDQNQDDKFSHDEMLTFIQGIPPWLADEIPKEFQLRDLDQNKVLENMELSIFGFMYFYNHVMLIKS